MRRPSLAVLLTARTGQILPIRNAGALRTGDDHMLTLRFYKGIWTLSRAEFVAELEAAAR